MSQAASPGFSFFASSLKWPESQSNTSSTEMIWMQDHHLNLVSSPYQEMYYTTAFHDQDINVKLTVSVFRMVSTVIRRCRVIL